MKLRNATVFPARSRREGRVRALVSKGEPKAPLENGEHHAPEPIQRNLMVIDEALYRGVVHLQLDLILASPSSGVFER